MPKKPSTPKFLEPRLRLFLGADIVGSTALKQSRGEHNHTKQAAEGPAWFPAIQGFYFEAAQAFLLHWQKSKEKSLNAESLYGPDPKLWKTVGDEVLFVKEITDHRQIAIAIQCWKFAVKRMKEFLRLANRSLDVKATCWTAGFPYRNREVVLDQNNILSAKHKIEDYYLESGRLLNKHYNQPNNSKLTVDYIGPSIDTGFRLSSYSSGRKFVVSVDVAYFLSMTQIAGEVERHDLYYDGAASLKGVIGGSNYPIFWMDMSTDDSLARKEDKLKVIHSVNLQDVRDYCEAFYEEHVQFTFRPFVHNDVGQTLGETPSWYTEYHAKLVENFLAPDSDYSADDSKIAQQEATELSDGEIEEATSSLVPSQND